MPKLKRKTVKKTVYEGGSESFVTSPVFLMIHLQFQKVPWHSFEVAFLEVYAPFHPNPPLLEAMAVL